MNVYEAIAARRDHAREVRKRHKHSKAESVPL